MINERYSNLVSKHINASFLTLDEKQRALAENRVKEIFGKGGLVSDEVTLKQRSGG